MKKNISGFTIVELLIVIVVIAILAAISIVSYNGIQQRAKETTIVNDLAHTIKKAHLSKVNDGTAVRTTDILNGDFSSSFTKNIYKVYTICAASDGRFAIAAEDKSGNVFISNNGAPPAKSTSVNSVNPCSSLGISGASTIYLGMPNAACSVQLETCAFSGSQTIAYGNPERGQFVARTDQSSPVSCNNTYFGDPAYGYPKWCYVLSY